MVKILGLKPDYKKLTDDYSAFFGRCFKYGEFMEGVRDHFWNGVIIQRDDRKGVVEKGKVVWTE
jgi:hypothetical protein